MMAQTNSKMSTKQQLQAMKRVLGYMLRNYKFSFLIVVICILGSVLATLRGTLFMQSLIDDYIVPLTQAQTPDYTALAGALLSVGGTYGLGILCAYSYNRIMVNVSQGTMRNLRIELFRHMASLPIRYFDTHAHGDIMSVYTNDVDTLRQLMSQSVPQVINSSVTILTSFVSMLVLDVPLTLITLAAIGVMLFVTSRIAAKSSMYFARQQKDLGIVNGYIEEMMDGQKVVKVFCHEEIAEEEFGWLNADLKEKQIRAQFFGGVMGPVMNNLSQLNYGLTACIGGLLCVFRNFDVGGLTVFLGFSRQFSRPINELSMQVGNVFSALAGAERVFAVLDAEPEAADAPDAVSIAPIRGEVVLDHVTFGYEPGQVILKDISLYAKPGQKIAFVGSTGAGKTTITNLINRFYDIQGGSITVDGVDVRWMHRKELRENIAMVLQDTHLFTGTVRENIRYGRLDATDEEVVEAAKTASAHSFIMRLPDGYDTMLEGDGANLSQGQRQLLNIARAAVSKAPILILDEATSSVDTRTEKHIEHGMDRLMADRTTFVIAHRLSTVRNANAIMVLEHGQIIERGDHEDLLAQKGRYFELYTGMKELE